MKMIYIAGPGRSGSTMLSTLLSQGVDVLNLGQSKDFGEAYSQNAACTCGLGLQKCELWSAVASDIFQSSPTEDIANLTAQKKLFLKSSAKIDDWSDTQSLANLATEHKSYLDSLGLFLRSVSQHGGVQAVVDSSKTPELALALSLVDGVDLRVLNLVRDPRAVASSWEKKSGEAVAKKHIGVWENRQKRLSQWSHVLSGKMKVIRYEDLTAMPRESIAKVLSWAELQPEVIFTSSYQAQISWRRQHLFPPANESFLAEMKTSIDVVTATAWDNPANKQLHSQVEDQLSREMRQYDYLKGD